MNTYWTTFGFDHVHRIGKIVVDRNLVIEFRAADYEAARRKMFAIFGRKWFAIYDTMPTMDHYPRGIYMLDH